LGVVVGIAAAYFGAYYFAKDLLIKSFLVAVAGGFASAAIATGSLKAGLWGAVSAAAFWGVGTYFSAKVTVNVGGSEVVHRIASGTTLAKVAAHAITGGTLTQLQGGKFGHGFVAAGFTEALSPAVGQIDGDGFGAVLSRTAVSAAIGGTVSKLSGGSFANGAKTGAFQQLFNSTIHDFFNSARKFWASIATEHQWSGANAKATEIYNDMWGENLGISAYDEDDNGTTHCAELIKHKGTFSAPHTSTWRAGRPLKWGMELATGTAIATFDANGRYYGSTGHAAIFLRWDVGPLGEQRALVIDQWNNNMSSAGIRILNYRPLQMDFDYGNAIANRVNNYPNFSTIRW
jgi:hypothetical protein